MMKRYTVQKLLFLLLLVCSQISRLQAASESYIQTLTGKIKKNDSCTVIDDKFLNLPLADWNRLQHLSVDNLVSFEIRFDTSVYFYNKPFTCKLNVTIKYYTSRDQQTPDEISNLDLIVRYDTAGGAQFPATAQHKFKNAFKVVVVVNSITSQEFGQNIPAIFRIKNQILVERKYPFSAVANGTLQLSYNNPANTGGMAAMNRVELEEGTGQLEIRWQPSDFPNSEEYDIEWTFIDGMSKNANDIYTLYGGISGVINIPDAKVEEWMRNDNTRVTVPVSSYTINLPYPNGYVLVRVRGAYYQMNPAVRLHTPWTYRIDANTTACHEIKTAQAHEPSINWQYNGIFAEEGKKKEVLTYFDGTLRNRQLVTVNNSDQTVITPGSPGLQPTAIVQETFYDDMGRATLSALPAPARSKSLNYYRSFNRNSQNAAYSHTDINLEAVAGANCRIGADWMSNTTSGASQYYSGNNVFRTEPGYYFTPYVPDAEKYPFSVTEYTPDNTGRIRRQGGVGNTFQLGQGHETTYRYSKPAQKDLDRIFGSEAGDASHYLRNTVVDPNGQISVSYIDAKGRTVATALAGQSPKNVDPLESSTNENATTQFNQRLIGAKDFKRSTGEMLMRATSVFDATVTGTFQVHYTVNPASVMTTHSLGQFCNTCYYEVLVEVKNDCGERVAQESSTPFTANDVLCNPNATVVTRSLPVPIGKIGEYTVTYTLQLSEQQVKYHTDYYIENNSDLKKLQQFFQEELNRLDLTGCYTTCEACQTLGTTPDAFREKVIALLNTDKFTGIQVGAPNSPLRQWIDQTWTTLRANCATLNCNATGACDSYLEKMKKDVLPGGQYALYTFNETNQQYALAEPSINVMAFYNAADFPDVQFTNEYGQQVSRKGLTQSEFIKAYITHPEWADDFVKKHIEYCSYLWCKNSNETSENFDKTLQERVASGADAISRGYYNRADMMVLLNVDPFFSTSIGSAYKTAMQQDINIASTALRMTMKNNSTGALLATKNLFQLVDWALYCKPTSLTATGADFSNSWNCAAPSTTCRSETMEWEMYRSYYLQLKRKYVYKAKMQNNPNCKDCFIGTDMMSQGTSSNCSAPVGPCANIGEFAKETRNYEIAEPNDECITHRWDVYIVHNGGPVLRRTRVRVRHMIRSSSNSYSLVTFEPGQSEIYLGRGIAYGGRSSDPNIICNPGTTDYFLENDAPICEEVNRSTCTDHPLYSWYANKTRVFFDFVNEDGYLKCLADNGNGQQPPTLNEILAKLRPFALQELGIQRAAWKERLIAVRNGESILFSSITDATIDQLVTALYEVAKKNIEISTNVNKVRGASTLPAGINSSLNHNSFTAAFQAYIGTTLMSKGFNPYLLDKPYPHDKDPIIENHKSADLSTLICSNIAQLRTRFASSGSPSFHAWLQQELKEDYSLTEAQLANLEARCSSKPQCRYLNEHLVLPGVFTTPSTANIFLNCSQINTFTGEFQSLFPGVNPQTHGKLYRLLITNYLNHKLGFSHPYDEYVALQNNCTLSPQIALYNKAANPSIPTDDLACVKGQLSRAYERAGQEYDYYITQERKKFRNLYISRCLENSASANLEGERIEYHYTLYYYDQSDNLVKTIPPEGVRFLHEPELSEVDNFRDQSPASCNGAGIPASENKTATLNAFSSSLSNNSAKATEFWLYNNDGTTDRHVRIITPDHKYFYQVAIHQKKLWAELYLLQPSGSEIEMILTNKAAGEIGDISLQKWSHVMIQSGDFDGTPWDLYLDGRKLTNIPESSAPGYPFEWEITSGTGYTLPVEVVGQMKHFRVYNRPATGPEIYDNYKNSCLSPVKNLAPNPNPLLVWGRFNIPVPGSETTTGPGSTNEYAGRFIVPLHGLPTNYVYNSFNQVTSQTSPDGGTTNFWYDRIQRLIVSQNSEQKTSSNSDPSNRYSYTKYDVLGRISEVGEKLSGANISGINTRNESAVETWYATGSDRSITQTVYDEAPSFAPGLLTNLRHRVAASIFIDNRTATSRNASYHSYDISGNVKTLYQEIGGLKALDAGSGIKRIDYEYDLISGKVNLVKYQQGKGDQFFYNYIYDADNRVVEARTSRDKLTWNTEARYRYYLHGPLARMQLGQLNVQGLDYAYTLQGWLKGINNNYLMPKDDMGKDGETGSAFQWYGRDAFGFTLHYFNNDYKAIASNAEATAFRLKYESVGTFGRELFNGNIAAITSVNSRFNNKLPTGVTYNYDQLNRLLEVRHHNVPQGPGAWSGISDLYQEPYREKFSYDANGNILSFERNGNTYNANSGYRMDALSYNYNRDVNGRLLNDKLRNVNDEIDGGTYTVDLDNQIDDNYSYDKIGNLISDQQENISSILWNVYGKIRTVNKPGNIINYEYDASGNRVAKSSENGQKKSFFVRDPQGNVLGIYEYTASNNKLFWAEQHLYGSGRLGMWNPNKEVTQTWTPPAQGTEPIVLGQRYYELTNHLGNVLSVITDKLKGVDEGGNGTVDYYEPEVVSASEYYAFGMQKPGRGYNLGDYRYGFNGKENDSEVKGEGNQQDYGMRIYDGRLGRFLSNDPLTGDYPELTPYQFASNTPVQAIDLDGEEALVKTKIDHVGKNGLLFTESKTNIDWTRLNITNTHYEIHKQVTYIYQNGSNSLMFRQETIISDKLVFDNVKVTKPRDDKRKLDKATLDKIAKKLEADPVAVAAIAHVESGGGGFMKDGRVKLRFEGHKMKEFMLSDGYNIKKLQEAGYGSILYGYSQRNNFTHGYSDYQKALGLNEKNAMLSTSYGAFQIMGFNYKLAGFKSVGEFVASQDSFNGQVEAFMNFISQNELLLNALRKKDFTKFAYGYNGSNYEDNKYDIKMQKYYDTHK